MFSKRSKRAVPLFGLALLALAALSASASGAELPPENISLPGVTAEYPKAVSGKGVWKNEPTSYTFEWSRCNAAGTECSTIPGATGSSITLTDADLGKTFVSKVTAYNAYGQASASSKPSNIVQVPTLHWYAAGSKIAEGTPTGFKMTSSGAFKLTATYAGTNIEVKCTSEKTEGTIENPSGAGAGTLSSAQLAFSGCTVAKPINSKCTIEGGGFTIGAVTGVTTGFEYRPSVQFNTSGFKVPYTGAGCSLIGLKDFAGSFIGMANGFSGSSLEFTAASTSGLYLVAGGKAALGGTSSMETTSGSAVTLAP